MEEKKQKTEKITPHANKKKEKVVKKKRKKITQQQLIKIIAIILIVVFVGGIVGSGIASVIFKNTNPTGSNFQQIDVSDQLLASAKEFQAKVDKDPKDSDSLYNLVEIYSQLGYLERSKKNETVAVNNFLKAVDYATDLKAANPTMATSADYLRAGYLAEAGKLDEAKVIYEAVIAGKTDPLISRIVYAEFLKSKVKDEAAAAVQVQAAKDAAVNDDEKEYVESLLKQYSLN